jgi:hypothetical protein
LRQFEVTGIHSSTDSLLFKKMNGGLTKKIFPV